MYSGIMFFVAQRMEKVVVIVGMNVRCFAIKKEMVMSSLMTS